METNLSTSKGLPVFDVMVPHARSATVSIASLIMVISYPVSGSICHIYAFHPDLTSRPEN